RLGVLWLLLGVAVVCLLVGGFGLVHGALIFVQRVGRLVEPCLWGIAVLRELAGAVVGLLCQDHAGLRSLQCGLARRDDLGPRAGIDVRELRFGDDFGSLGLLVLCDRLGVIDLDQHCAGRDVLPAFDRDLADPAIDPRRDL